MNQALKLSVLKFQVAVAWNELLELGKDAGLLNVTQPYPFLIELDDIETDESLFGRGYHKEPLVPFTREHIIAVGLLAVGIILVIIAHSFKEK